MNLFHDQNKVLTTYCCWKHWSGGSVQVGAWTLCQSQSTEPSKAKPRKHCKAFLVLLFSWKRATGQKPSAQQENGAAENIQAKWMNTDHISTTANNDNALGFKNPRELCFSCPLNHLSTLPINSCNFVTEILHSSGEQTALELFVLFYCNWGIL